MGQEKHKQPRKIQNTTRIGRRKGLHKRLRRSGHMTLHDYELLELILFGVPLIPHFAGGFLLSTFDRMVIAAKLDMKSVGIYFAAFQIVMIAKVIFDSLNKAFI